MLVNNTTSNVTKIDDGEEQNPEFRLSDVIEVIETDPSEVAECSSVSNLNPEILNNIIMQISLANQLSPIELKKEARVIIVEQPAKIRFRYSSEGKSAGSVCGVNTTADTKTSPSIRVEGYQGLAKVRVSCVSKDEPHRSHPNQLVSKEKNKECTNGILERIITIEGPQSKFLFKNIGIQRIKKDLIKAALTKRETLGVDPFSCGFCDDTTSIDVRVVRLCFEVFLESKFPGNFTVPLVPVVSDIIYDKQYLPDLSIVKLSACVSFVDGGKEDIILVCEKVEANGMEVRFYEENSDWEAFAEITTYKQNVIWFKTPPYKTLDVTRPVKVFIQLRRKIDSAFSEPRPFELHPPERNKYGKRQKNDWPIELLPYIPSIPATNQFGYSNFSDFGQKIRRSLSADKPSTRVALPARSQSVNYDSPSTSGARTSRPDIFNTEVMTCDTNINQNLPEPLIPIKLNTVSFRNVMEASSTVRNSSHNSFRTQDFQNTPHNTVVSSQQSQPYPYNITATNPAQSTDRTLNVVDSQNMYNSLNLLNQLNTQVTVDFPSSSLQNNLSFINRSDTPDRAPKFQNTSSNTEVSSQPYPFNITAMNPAQSTSSTQNAVGSQNMYNSPNLLNQLNTQVTGNLINYLEIMNISGTSDTEVTEYSDSFSKYLKETFS